MGMVEYFGQKPGALLNPLEKHFGSMRNAHQNDPAYQNMHATLVLRRALRMFQGFTKGSTDLAGRFGERLQSWLEPVNAMACNYASVVIACKKKGIDVQAMLAVISQLEDQRYELMMEMWKAPDGRRNGISAI